MSDRYDYDYQRDTELEDAYNYFVISDDAGVVVAVYCESQRTLAEDDFADRRAKGETVHWDYLYSRTRIRVGMTVSMRRVRGEVTTLDKQVGRG